MAHGDVSDPEVGWVYTALGDCLGLAIPLHERRMNTPAWHQEALRCGQHHAPDERINSGFQLLVAVVGGLHCWKD